MKISEELLDTEPTWRCQYCGNEGSPIWIGDLIKDRLTFMCEYHRRAYRAGYLELVTLVEEAYAQD